MLVIDLAANGSDEAFQERRAVKENFWNTSLQK